MKRPSVNLNYRFLRTWY